MVGALLRDARRDAALALRQLRRRPGFAAATILTLTLGIGAPTAIFSIVRAVLLRPLPFQDADRIVRFRIESQTHRGPIAFDALGVSTALDWAATSTTLTGIALFNDAARTLVTADGPVRLTGLSATPNLFEILGAQPMAGSIFAAADRDVRQIVLSHSTWQRHFSSDRAIVGTSVTLDGRPHRITGVMPEGFDFPTPETAFWVPVILSSGGSRGMILPAIGRLAPNVMPAAVAEEGLRHLRADDPSGNERVVVRTLQEQMVGGARRTLWVLMAAVSLVSVVATVNIALLLLTRGAGRAREFSVRLALGAARNRLIRQVAVEGAVLAATGGIAGLLFAVAAAAILVRIAPAELPRLHETSFDLSVLGFSAALTLVASLLFAALSAGRMVTGDVLRTLTGSSVESRLAVARVPQRYLSGLAAAELALAMVLLLGAGLLLRSFVGLVLVDQGFDTTDRAALQLTLPSATYPSPEARMAAVDRLLTSLRQTPGIENAAVITAMPNRQPTGRFAYDAIGIDPFAEPGTLKLAEVRMASDDFFDAMGVRLLQGRGITAEDTASAPPVMVISEALARMHFPTGSAVGRMLLSRSGDRLVVGVVSDVRPAVTGLPQYDPSAYLPLAQNIDVFEQFSSVHLVVRGVSARQALDLARVAIRNLDPSLAPFNVRTLDDEVGRLVAGPRFTAMVIGLFAVVALVMAGIGVYGVMAYVGAQRTREIGIRTALGATRQQVLALMLRDGVIVVAAGLFVGTIAAIWLARGLTGLLHEVTPADPLALVVVGLLLAVTGLTGAYLPARRATRVSVLAALRDE